MNKIKIYNKNGTTEIEETTFVEINTNGIKFLVDESDEGIQITKEQPKESVTIKLISDNQIQIQ